MSPCVVGRAHPCALASYSYAVPATQACLHLSVRITLKTACHALSASGRVAGCCVPMGTPRLNTAPLVICDAGARQKAVYGGGTCPHLQRIAGRYGLATLSALPRPLDRWRDFVPRQRPKRRKGVVGLPVRAGARSPLGARLGPGTPARLVVGWPTSCATDCALERAGPVVIPRRLPEPSAQCKRARNAGSLNAMQGSHQAVGTNRAAGQQQDDSVALGIQLEFVRVNVATGRGFQLFIRV